MSDAAGFLERFRAYWRAPSVERPETRPLVRLRPLGLQILRHPRTWPTFPRSSLRR